MFLAQIQMKYREGFEKWTNSAVGVNGYACTCPKGFTFFFESNRIQFLAQIQMRYREGFWKWTNSTVGVDGCALFVQRV